MVRIGSGAVRMLLLASLALGCGGGEPEDTRETASISGTVLSKGKPLTGSGLTLILNPGSQPVLLEISSSGTFSGDAVVGENQVMIQTPEGAHAEGGQSGVEGVHPSLLDTSNDPSPVTITVPKEGASDLKIEVGEPEAAPAGPADGV